MGARSTAANVCFVPSSRYGGTSRIGHAVHAIRGGGVSLVILLTRWLGHADSDRITQACRTAGIPWRAIDRGIAAALLSIGGEP